MKDTKKILLDSSLNPESKVYLIASILKEEDKIWDDLWYAVLDLKDKHLNDIMTKETLRYLSDERFGDSGD